MENHSRAELQEKKESTIDEREQYLSTMRLELATINQGIATLREEKKQESTKSKKSRLRHLIPKSWRSRLFVS